MQGGVRAAAGVLLGASVVSGVFAIFMPIETMGRSLPEDTEEIQELAILERENTAGKIVTGHESNGHDMHAFAVTPKAEAAEQENPFHVNQLEVPSESAPPEYEPS